MADFSTGAELELEVSDSSLRDAKSTIENELGNLEVDVNAIVSGGGGRQPRDPSSGRFMAMEGVEQRVVNSNEYLEDIRNILLDMDDKIGGGGMMAAGGGGGDGGTTILGATGLGGLLGGSGGTAGGGVLAGLLGGTGGLIGGSILGGVGALALMDRNLSDERKREMGRQNQQVREQARAGNLDVMMSPFAKNGGGPSGGFEWPPLPDLSQEVDWPRLDLPEAPGWVGTLDNIFGGGGASGMQANSSFNMGGPQAFTPGSGGRARMDPSVGGGGGGGPQMDIDLGGITVDITTTIDSAVDDAVQDIEKTIDREVGDLERRVSDALGGFF